MQQPPTELPVLPHLDVSTPFTDSLLPRIYFAEKSGVATIERSRLRRVYIQGFEKVKKATSGTRYHRHGKSKYVKSGKADQVGLTPSQKRRSKVRYDAKYRAGSGR